MGGQIENGKLGHGEDIGSPARRSTPAPHGPRRSPSPPWKRRAGCAWSRMRFSQTVACSLLAACFSVGAADCRPPRSAASARDIDPFGYCLLRREVGGEGARTCAPTRSSNHAASGSALRCTRRGPSARLRRRPSSPRRKGQWTAVRPSPRSSSPTTASGGGWCASTMSHPAPPPIL